jgi:hypothetical protein
MSSLGSSDFFFLFDAQYQPTIEVQGIPYTALGEILHFFPEFHQSQNLEKLAQIANFLANSLEFQYIENIEAFKEDYYQQIEAEQSFFPF